MLNSNLAKSWVSRLCAYAARTSICVSRQKLKREWWKIGSGPTSEAMVWFANSPQIIQTHSLPSLGVLTVPRSPPSQLSFSLWLACPEKTRSRPVVCQCRKALNLLPFKDRLNRILADHPNKNQPFSPCLEPLLRQLWESGQWGEFLGLKTRRTRTCRVM